jgi:PKD repeat protein
MNLMMNPRILFALLAVSSPFLCAHDDHDHIAAYEFRHWEKASPDPDRIVLTWTDDPATTQAVTWRTDTSVETGFAEIVVASPSARFDEGAERVVAISQTLDLSQDDRNAKIKVRYHTVEFTGLEPETLYAYRVGNGNGRWSEWIQFETASDQAQPVEFLYFGDAQNSVLSHWSRIIRAAYKKAPDADFSIHAGDLINRAHRDQEWAEWFKAGGWIHASVPSIVVPGNHEYDRFSEEDERQKELSVQWGPQFALPVYDDLPTDLTETVYYIDYQGVRIVALDSNREIEAQTVWLDKVLTENPHDWAVVTFHHPLFSSREGRNNSRNRAAWKPILDKHQVDLVLQGHDHTYARGHTPVRMTDGGSAKEVTTMYVNSVSGPKMYEFMKAGWDVYRPDGVILDRRAEDTTFFQVIRIDGPRLVYKAYMANGELYDAFELGKRQDGSKEMRDWSQDLGDERKREATMEEAGKETDALNLSIRAESDAH